MKTQKLNNVDAVVSELANLVYGAGETFGAEERADCKAAIEADRMIAMKAGVAPRIAMPTREDLIELVETDMDNDGDACVRWSTLKNWIEETL